MIKEPRPRLGLIIELVWAAVSVIPFALLDALTPGVETPQWRELAGIWREIGRGISSVWRKGDPRHD